MHTKLLAMILILFCTRVLAQAPTFSGVTPPSYTSPTASSLGKFGDIPISYQTGTPEVSIPLYTIKEGSLTLPVTLSYHSSGIRVPEVASWVGLGWTLSAGGMITRMVHGGPDDGYVDLSRAMSPRKGWGYYKDGGAPAELAQCENTANFPGLQQNKVNGPLGCLANFTTCYPCFNYYFDASQGYIDLEPDLYTFSFNGYSGKFFFDDNRNVHVFPEDDLYIVPILVNNKFDGWVIRTPDGVKYTFGGSGATESTKSDPTGAFTSPQEHIKSTTWYLNKVESPNGEDYVTLIYADESYSFGNRNGHSVNLAPPGYSCTMCGGSPIIADPVLNWSLVSGKRLTQITTRSGNIVVDFKSDSLRLDVSSGGSIFSPNISAKTLNSVIIKAPNVFKQFKFSYAYFNSTAPCPSNCSPTTPEARRLKLLRMQELDASGNTLPPYSFVYNNTRLPNRYSLARDLYDYYNGFDSNQGLIDNDVVNPITLAPLNTGNYRRTVELPMMAGILTRINYPTGGFSAFTYEANRALPGGPLVGGLRVTSVINDDGMGSQIVRNVSYGNGLLYTSPSYFQYPDNNTQKTQAYTFGIIISSTPVTAMWSTLGYHIGYGEVTESQPGNGYRVYRYTNSNPIGVPNPSVYPMSPLQAGYGTNDLVGKEVYNQAGNMIQKSSTEKLILNVSPLYQKVRRVINVSCIPPANCNGCACSGSGQPNNLFTDYYISDDRYRVTSVYEMQDQVSTNTSFEYGLLRNTPTAQIVLSSSGSTLRTEWTYPVANGTAPPAMYDLNTPNFKNMIGLPIEQRKYVNGTLVNKAQNNYTSIGTSIVLSNYREYKAGTTEYVDKNYSYDGSSLRLTNLTGTGGNSKSFVWGYGNQFPIAEIANAQANQVFHTSFEDYSAQPISADAKTGKYSYASNLPFTVVLPSPGAYTLFYWSKIQGGTWQANQVQVTSNAAIGGNGILIDEVRLYPAGALMTTYTYDPALGITSVTDPNFQTTTYEYDSFGRLKATRDARGNIVQSYQYNYKQ